MFFGSAPVVAEAMPTQAVWSNDSEILNVAIPSSSNDALLSEKN
jgi:hypothetical protein